MGHYKDVQDELRGQAKQVRELAPEVWSAFAGLHRAAMADGALPAKVKELIALAIAVTRECDGCIASHARAAARAGATAEEVADMVSVCILMNGGPGTVYGPRAFAAFQELGGAAGQPAGPPASVGPGFSG
ncbi:MAG: carboxymuconolactone decarboxylase family protein [Acidimicrobiales bacterium]|nr:carboxymuconolactone decarboxylase family protein [Acidimicrobiales bacterium]